MDSESDAPAPKNLLEILGLKSTAAQHWDPHVAVGLSSLCFAVPSAAFCAVPMCILQKVSTPFTPATNLQLVMYTALAVLYTLVMLTSCSADYIFIRNRHRSWYGKVDIILASITFFISMTDFAMRASALETMALTLIAVFFFIYSGASKSFEQWVFRHTIWHVVASCVATYGAFRNMPERSIIGKEIDAFFAGFCGVYATMAGLAIAGAWTLGSQQRAQVFAFFADFADYKPVLA